MRSNLLMALQGTMPLVEPVYISKALCAGRQARAVLDGGKGPKATVHLVNIGLTGWTHTKETAEAFADGYNLALKQLRASLLDVVEQEQGPSTVIPTMQANGASPTLANLASLPRHTFPAGPAQGSEPLADARGNYFSVSDVIGLFSATIAEFNSARAVAVVAQGVDENIDALIFPPKALLKREDWDATTRKPRVPVQGVALTDAQIDDMAFAYAPSGMIGELREFARALLAQAQPADASRQMVGEDDVRDAARYRFLRDHVWADYPGLQETIQLQLNAKWDRSIDVAIAAIGSAKPAALTYCAANRDGD